jgi:hypothetical protein
MKQQINAMVIEFANNGAEVIDATSTVMDAIGNTVHCDMHSTIIGLFVAVLYALVRTIKD